MALTLTLGVTYGLWCKYLDRVRYEDIGIAYVKWNVYLMWIVESSYSIYHDDSIWRE